MIEVSVNGDVEDTIRKTLFGCVVNNDCGKIEYLIKEGFTEELEQESDEDGYTVLHRAAACSVDDSHEKMIKLLLDAGIDVDVKTSDSTKRTPLHVLAQNRNGNQNILCLLVASGSNVNGDTLDGCSPLLYALDADNAILVEQLKAFGADVNESLYSLAMHPGETRTKLFELLLDHGANIYYKYVLSQLIEHGHAYNLREILFRSKADAMRLDPNGKTPLHYAAEGNDPRLVEYLLSLGADVDTKTEISSKSLPKDSKINQTPLMSAVFYSKGGSHVDVARVLLDHGADINDYLRVLDGSTPLHMAVYCADLMMIQYLVSRGADISIMCGDRTLLDHAFHNIIDFDFKSPERHRKIIKYLLKIKAPMTVLCEDGNIHWTRWLEEAVLKFELNNLVPPVRFLLNFWSPNVVGTNGSNVITFCEDRGLTEVAHEMIKRLAILDKSGVEIEPRILSAMWRNRGFGDYCVACIGELQLARRTRLNKTTYTMFDMLRSSKKCLVDILYTLDETGIKPNEFVTMTEKFPLYRTLILDKFVKVSKLWLYRGKFKSRLWKICPVLEDRILDDVTELLTVTDLKRFVRVTKKKNDAMEVD